jgi:predicted RNase H-like nuclease (RuvC/YqgF family)
MYIEGTVPNFHEFLDSKPDWVKLSAKRDAARKLWQDRNSQASQLIRAAYFTQAAEILEDRTIMYYQACMNEEESDAIHKWTGVHTELSADLYNEVVEHLREQASAIYEEVRDYKAETKRLEHELNKVQQEVSNLYEKLREEYNATQQPKE